MKARILLSLSVLALVIGAALPASANVTQHCTVGFYKNHTQFLNNGSCAQIAFNSNTVVSTVFPDVDPCVGAMTFLQVMSAPSSACGGANTLAGGEIILLRQGITRLANAAYSAPTSCNALLPTIAKANTTIDDAIATDNRQVLITLSQVWGFLNNDGSCTLP
jgi:hypothetical protein